jgi:hypothetical protein
MRGVAPMAQILDAPARLKMARRACEDEQVASSLP